MHTRTNNHCKGERRVERPGSEETNGLEVWRSDTDQTIEHKS